MSVRPWPMLLSAALVWLFVPSPVHAERKSPVRFRLEAGPSFDRTDHVYGNRGGYAVAGGIELGRKLGLILTVGYEHYSGEIEPYLLQTGQSGPITPTVRVEGDVTKSAISSSFGVRFGAPLGALDGFIEGAVGGFTTSKRDERWVDPSTGALVAGGDVGGSSVSLLELGGGLRTRRVAHFDWTLGVRFRQWAQLMEAGEAGKSVQLSIGVVTP